MNKDNPAIMKCLNCQVQQEVDAVVCTSCGYPHHGTEEDKNRFVNEWIEKSTLYKQALRTQRMARTTFLLIALMSVVVAVVLLVMRVNWKSIGFYGSLGYAGIAVVFLLLWYGTKYVPYTCIIIGLVLLFADLWVSITVSAYSLLLQGTLIKLIMMAALVHSLWVGLRLQGWKQKYESLRK